MALFPRKSLESIVTAFTKAQTELRNYADANRIESRQLYDQAEAIELAAYELNKDADKAERILKNINSILDEDQDMNEIEASA